MQELRVGVNAKALIFDVDGTLADSMPVHYKAWEKTARNHGLTFSEKYFYELAGVPTPKIAQLVMGKATIDEESLKLAIEKEENYLEMIHLIQPVKPVVAIVRKYYGKLPIAAGTGSTAKFARITLDVLGISDCFQALVSYEDVERPKPAPDTFLKCASLLQIEPRYCQVFEDGEPGLIAARAAGMIATDVRPFL